MSPLYPVESQAHIHLQAPWSFLSCPLPGLLDPSDRHHLEHLGKSPPGTPVWPVGQWMGLLVCWAGPRGVEKPGLQTTVSKGAWLLGPSKARDPEGGVAPTLAGTGVWWAAPL
jgi:hypothetical protein